MLLRPSVFNLVLVFKISHDGDTRDKNLFYDLYLSYLAKILYITPFFNFPPKDGASYRSVYLFEKLCEKHDVVLLTYPNKGLESYSGQINGKIRIHEMPFKRKSNHSFFQRLISTELPGFATHDINTISENIDNLILEYGQFDIHYFATQLMGQIVLKKIFWSKYY